MREGTSEDGLVFNYGAHFNINSLSKQGRSKTEAVVPLSFQIIEYVFSSISMFLLLE